MRPVPRIRLLAIGGAAALFAVSARLMLRLLPGPLTPFDYMVVGTLATSIALLGFFVALTFRARNVFFKKRSR